MAKIIITIEVPDGSTVATSTKATSAPETSAPATRQDAPGSANQSDPWDSPTGNAGRGAASRTEPSKANTADTGNVRVVETKNGVQTWTFHAPNAPLCGCDQPAAHVQGTKKDGKPWKAWRCAKGADPENWRDKCDTFESA